MPAAITEPVPSDLAKGGVIRLRAAMGAKNVSGIKTTRFHFDRKVEKGVKLEKKKSKQVKVR